MNNVQKTALAVVVALAVVLGVSEFVKANNRKAAYTELNQNFNSLQSSAAKLAAVIKADTIITQNRSWFDFNSSGANEKEMDYPLYDGGEGWNYWNYDETITDVTTESVWFNPLSLQWEPLR